MSSKDESRFPYTIKPFNKNQHERAGFSCGSKSLDRYLKKQANQDLKRKLSVTYVLVEGDHPGVIGYYALSQSSVRFKALPSGIQDRLPRYPQIPATLIGRLAIDEEYQGNRLGEHLLLDALRNSYEKTSEIGSFSVVVDLVDENARGFYLKYDFRPLPDNEDKLFIPMKKVEKLLKAVGGF